MTLAEVLRDAEARLRAEDIGDAHLEAEVLLCHALGVTRERLFSRLQEHTQPAEHEAFDALLERRLEHEPAAYIVGHKEFYGLELACTPAAPIPRPETELLVEYAIEWLGRRERAVDANGRPLIADVGTGNGAIAVAIASHLPNAGIVATDTSRDALALARRNAEAHGVAGRIDAVQGSLLEPVRSAFDAIVANLPYVPSRTYERLPPEIRVHEPEQALLAGADGSADLRPRRGSAIIEELLVQAPDHLRPGGLLLAEHAWNQGRRLREAAKTAFPSAEIETKRDLAGRERMLVVETP